MNGQKVVVKMTLMTVLVNRDVRRLGRRQFGESVENDNHRTKVVIPVLFIRDWFGMEDNRGRHDGCRWEE